MYLDHESRLVYAAASRPMLDRFETIEATLPIADLALWRPRHRVVDLALGYLASAKKPASGLIYTQGTLSAEGAYTVAYPLAAIGAARGDKTLSAGALRQLLGRRDRLWHEDALWLRHMDGGNRMFRNWSRGVAWYFLGLVRSLSHLRAAGVDVRELEAEIRLTAAFVRRHQRSDGLWNCFLDDRGTAPDSSGSAGIAAALALAARAGTLSAEDLAAAQLAIPALIARLTPDGFLTGVTQGNRGGERLQRSDYRVISQMGMGLMGQLLAAAQPEG
jgi:rhamnogalacturonyl hydrolase YesR